MNPRIVSRDQWLAARKRLLIKEREFTRVRDAMAAYRRDLPWVKIDKSYAFDGPGGRTTLGEMFAGRSQLIVYHFMFGPGWEQGCPSCSYLADHFDGAVPHLRQRDVTMAVVSRAPLAEIEAYKKRMGWKFDWLSSHDSDFNRDFGVTFTDDEVGNGTIYNYGTSTVYGEEMPGISVFARNAAGEVFHTYSTYARGLDILIGTYNFLDLVPKGRDEDRLPWTMAWVKRRDEYELAPLAAGNHDCCK